MFFGNPRVEFVSIDLTICSTDVVSGGGGLDCIRVAANNDCPGYKVFMKGYVPPDPNNEEGEKRVAKEDAKPKNVVGFDMTFDK